MAHLISLSALAGCLALGCASAGYVIEGDSMTVRWKEDGWWVFFPSTHTLRFPNRNGRIEASEVSYTEVVLFARKPRGIRGYLELDLPRKVLLVCLRFPSDRKKGWDEAMDIEMDEWLHDPVSYTAFYGNGRYRLVQRSSF